MRELCTKQQKDEKMMQKVDFDFQRIAQGYRRRPFLHRQVIERFQREVTSRTFEQGLDIGCGAGLSAKALKLICRHVTGIDVSAEMILAAKEVCGNEEDFEFMAGQAEKLPAFAQKFDIVTAAGVDQWVDMPLFLKGLWDKMNSRGYLLVYDFCISDKMKGCTAYTTWWYDVYLKAFPRPYRNEAVWTGEAVAQCGFWMMDQVQYEMAYEFDLDSFIEFMMIQSNVNAKIEGEGRSTAETAEWFRQSAGPLFQEGDGEQGALRTLLFTGYSWYMQRK